MGDRIRMTQQESKQIVTSAYQQAVALEHLLDAAGDKPVVASMVKQLLQPLITSLDKAAED